MNRCAAIFPVVFLLALSVGARAGVSITLDDALAAKTDLWGEAALAQSNGPDYDFFAKLLPPLRYVNTAFRCYPIVLSAPGALRKARLVSDGSAINARAGVATWKDMGTPVSFYVGPKREAFGENAAGLIGPVYERGYLPVVQISCPCGGQIYREETFADIAWASNALVLTKFTVPKNGMVTAQWPANSGAHSRGRTVRDTQGNILASFDSAWTWDANRAALMAHRGGWLAIATIPLPAEKAPAISALHYEREKKKCIDTWEAILRGAMRVETPEPLVNTAWKSTLIGSLILRKGDDMNYSAGNAYETMYEAESGDAARALLLWGLEQDGRQLIRPLLNFRSRPGLRFHDAAFKLQLLAHYYWLTRDATFVRALKPAWSQSVDILTRERDRDTGLLPRENYCGDESEKVFSLNADANTWRGLRDLAVVLGKIGEPEAAAVGQTAQALRAATITAVNQSEYTNAQPPFIPVALFGREKLYDTLTATRRGSYYVLMIPYVIGSEIFGSGSARETAMVRYLEQHGGVCMGMLRFNQHSGLFANEDALDDLYGLRYDDALLRRDEPDRALVSFYGKLAQGMTRGTFLSAEGTGLRPLDDFGRPMYLPPVSSGDGYFLTLLRSMLAQDYVNTNGEPDELRLLFATPRRWLEDGNEIKIDRAPTAFGMVSMRVESRLKRGEVTVELDLPQRQRPKHTWLRIRLPEGWQAQTARNRGHTLSFAEPETLDISGLAGHQTIQIKVSHELRNMR